MGRKKTTARDDEAVPPATGKSKKKALVIEDDEYSVSTELSEEPQIQEDKLPNANKNKGKKGAASKGMSQLMNEDDKNVVEIDDEADIGPVITFAGKKKSTLKKGKGSNNTFSASNFSMLDDDGGDGDEDELGTSGVATDGDSDSEEEQVISFTGKKKSAKKGGKGGGASSAAAALPFDELNDEDGNDGEIEDDVESAAGEGEDDGISQFAFTGKKKPSKSKKKGGGVFTASGVGALDDDEEEAEQEKKVEEDEEDVSSFTFSGKKKKSSKSSKKGGNFFGTGLVDEAEVENPSVSEVTENSEDIAEDDDAIALSFSEKKKSSKKKSIFVNLMDETNLDGEIADMAKSEPTGVLGNGLAAEKLKIFAQYVSLNVNGLASL